ncbi:MAG TPA: hypothetical protein VFV39_05820, partial [Limnobacter sp.]|nr:hypothetical protein [Limnobacter sp.]
MPRQNLASARAITWCNASAPLPVSSHTFRHNLSHATQGLAQALRTSAKQNAFALDSDNSSTPPVGEAALKAALTGAGQSLRLAFEQQLTARQAFAADRKSWSQSVRTSLNTDSPVFEQLKVQADILPNLGKTPSGACCDSEKAAPDKASSKHAGGCDHEEGGGIVIDLDEAAHGAFASSKDLHDVAKGRPEAVVESFKADAAEMAQQPIQYLGNQLTHGGVAEFSTAVGAGV